MSDEEQKNFRAQLGWWRNRPDDDPDIRQRQQNYEHMVGGGRNLSELRDRQFYGMDALQHPLSEDHAIGGDAGDQAAAAIVLGIPLLLLGLFPLYIAAHATDLLVSYLGFEAIYDYLPQFSVLGVSLPGLIVTIPILLLAIAILPRWLFSAAFGLLAVVAGMMWFPAAGDMLALPLLLGCAILFAFWASKISRFLSAYFRLPRVAALNHGWLVVLGVPAAALAMAAVAHWLRSPPPDEPLAADAVIFGILLLWTAAVAFAHRGAD